MIRRMISETAEERLSKLRAEVGLAPEPEQPEAAGHRSSHAYRNAAGARKKFEGSQPGENPRSKALKGKTVADLMAEKDIPLNALEEKFVLAAAEGLNQTGAARQAGYADPLKAGKQLMKRPNVVAAVLQARKKYEDAAQMTRKKVMDGFLEAIQCARIQADSIAMISGWREIAKMCGYYEATKHKIDITVNGQLIASRIQTMSDEELLRLAEPGTETVEGEFSQVDGA